MLHLFNCRYRLLNFAELSAMKHKKADTSSKQDIQQSTDSHLMEVASIRTELKEKGKTASTFTNHYKRIKTMETKPTMLIDIFPKSIIELQLDSIDWSSVTSSVLHLLHESVDNYFQTRYAPAKDIADELLYFTWEKLNTGSWKDVSIAWRQLYSYGSLLKAASLCGLLEDCTDNNQRREQIQAVLKACDMGLLMGAPVLDNILSKLASNLQRVTMCPHGCDTERVTKERCLTTANDQLLYKKQKRFHQPEINQEKSILRMVCPALLYFKTRNMDKKIPVLIQGSMDHWPAMSHRRWSLEYLRQIAGSRTVPIEIGSKYTDENWSQTLLTLSEFIDTYVQSHDAEDDGIVKGYLAQHQLFEQVPELKQDICIPDYCCLRDTGSCQSETNVTQELYEAAGEVQNKFVSDASEMHKETDLHQKQTCNKPQEIGAFYLDKSDKRGDVNTALDGEDVVDDENVDINAWFGPKGTVSPLHHDPKHNLLAQVVGEKYIRLYSEEMTRYVYPHEGYLLNNTSQVNVENPDEIRFPLFSKAKYQECILQPGEMLYIPPKCWHYVRSLSTSFSVSFWWR